MNPEYPQWVKSRLKAVQKRKKCGPTHGACRCFIEKIIHLQGTGHKYEILYKEKRKDRKRHRVLIEALDALYQARLKIVAAAYHSAGVDEPSRDAFQHAEDLLKEIEIRIGVKLK